MSGGAGFAARGPGGGLGRGLGRGVAGLGRRLTTRWALPPGSGSWLRLDATRPLEELPTPRFAARPAPAFVHVLQALEHAAGDPRVDGVVVRLGGGAPGLASASSLARALAALVGAGKPVVAWGERLSATDLIVASGASRVFLTEAGSVALVGLRLETWFARDLLERVGVAPEVVRVGSFKSAGETFTRRSMSPEQREQLEALVEDRFEALVAAIAKGRGLTPERVRALVDTGPHGARDACDAGLVDGCRHPDELEQELERLAPPVGPRLRVIDLAAYHGLAVAGAGGFGPATRLAYLVAQGGIRAGDGSRGVAADPNRRLLARLAEDEAVRAVVLRVDSPGGDAVASDALWRGVERLRREKPVVASFAEVAASGGYYLAAGADRIFAEPACITGSIGVVGGKLDLSGLYERVGLRKEGVERGARAGIGSETRGFTRDERRAVRDEMRSLYDLFLQRVEAGRGLAREAVEPLAGGRVWSGLQARNHGLVDALGGPLEAIAEARRLAGLLGGEAAPLELCPRGSRLAVLRGLLPGAAVRVGGSEHLDF